MYWIELITTKKCNQSCYYCTTHTYDFVEVDLDYLKWVLDQCPDNLGVELTGGEIGLLRNLDETYRCIKDHSHVKHIIALSNGLVRAMGVDWINEVEYWEHLIHDLNGTAIEKFYDLDLDQDHKYVIVTTKRTTKSLLENWEWYKGMGFFRPNFFYKMMNFKSNGNIESYFNELANLYVKLDDYFHQNMLLHYHLKIKNWLKDEKESCERFSPNPFVDLQTGELGHCAINVNRSDKYPFNKRNLWALQSGALYRKCDYCKDCYTFDWGLNRGTHNNRSYKR